MLNIYDSVNEFSCGLCELLEYKVVKAVKDVIAVDVEVSKIFIEYVVF